MTNSSYQDLINYRLERAKDTLDEKVLPYFEPIERLIDIIEQEIARR